MTVQNTAPYDISVIDTVDDAGGSLILWTKLYRRKADGKPMLYVNSERRVSIAISEGEDTAKWSYAQRKLLKQFLTVLDEEESIPFTGAYDRHPGEKSRLAHGIALYVTGDTREVGGQPVPEDGAYLVRKGKLFAL